MKIIVPPTKQRENYSVIMPPSTEAVIFSDITGVPVDRIAGRAETFPGRTQITNAIIDFEQGTIECGLKYDQFVIDKYTLKGVIPAQCIRDNVYECYVDWFEQEI